jgi:hypothetical protein
MTRDRTILIFMISNIRSIYVYNNIILILIIINCNKYVHVYMYIRIYMHRARDAMMFQDNI